MHQTIRCLCRHDFEIFLSWEEDFCVCFNEVQVSRRPSCSLAACCGTASVCARMTY